MLEPLPGPAPAPFQQPLPELVRLSQLIRVTLRRAQPGCSDHSLVKPPVLIPGTAAFGSDTKWRPENTGLGSLTWNAAEQPWQQTWPAQGAGFALTLQHTLVKARPGKEGGGKLSDNTRYLRNISE